MHLVDVLVWHRCVPEGIVGVVHNHQSKDTSGRKLTLAPEGLKRVRVSRVLFFVPTAARPLECRWIV